MPRAPRTQLITLAASLTICGLALSNLALAFVDSHLNEISVPVEDYADGRATLLEVQVSLTKAEKKELKLLRKLEGKLAKPAKGLKSDFKELLLGAKTSKKLKAAGVPMQTALDEAFGLAELALGERREFVQDHLDLIVNLKTRGKVQRDIDKYVAARNGADLDVTNDQRAKLLGKAEVSITKALKRAEKEAQKVVTVSGGALSMPLVRLRSGDNVGAGGARIAIAAESDSPLAGASVIIPPSAIGVAGGVRITIEAADDFVAGRDERKGAAFTLLPSDLQLNAPVQVFAPFELETGDDVDALALFRDTGAEPEATLDVTRNPNGTVSAEFTSFGTFQSGLLAPPEGAPSGSYHVEMFTVVHSVETSGVSASQERIGIIEQDYNFRADRTGRTTSGIAPIIFRSTSAGTPHHLDGFSSSLVGSVDFTWDPTTFGAFDVSLPIQGTPVTASGIISTDGNVLSFSGVGSDFEFFAIGVRTEAANAVAADLDGRWLAIELGAHMQDAQATPFTTEYFSSFTGFDADSGLATLAYHGSGETFETDRTFSTNAVEALHGVSDTSTVETRSEDFLVFPSGQIQADSQRRRGWLNREAGILISSHSDLTTRRVSLQIAVRQPATNDHTGFTGPFRLSRIDLFAFEDSPQGPRSFLDVDVGTGTFVGAALDATVTMSNVDRATYELFGPPPITSIAWTSSVLLTTPTPAPFAFTLGLDTAGNHRPGNVDRWYGVSGNGNVILTSTPGLGGREMRGIGIGLR